MIITILTEAGVGIGYGHLIRCRSLAFILKKNGHKVRFLVNGKGIPAPMIDEETTIGEWLIDKDAIQSSIADADITVVDSYLMSLEQASYIYSISRLVLWFDDTNRLSYPGGIILNPAWHSERLYTKEDTRCHLLSGPLYQQFREAFLDPPSYKINLKLRRVMVFLGGAPQVKLNNQVAEEVKKIDPDIVCLHPIECSGQKKLGNVFLNDSDMRKAMESVDLIISGGGQILAECIRTSIPTIAVEIAENQNLNITGWEEFGAVLNAGSPQSSIFLLNLQNSIKSLISQNQRRKLSDKASEGFDGLGGQRVTTFLERHV